MTHLLSFLLLLLLLVVVVPPSSLVLALQRERITWYIDGHNLLGHKGTPRTVTALIQALEPIQGVQKISIVLDSKNTHHTQPILQVSPNNPSLETITLPHDISADDYIQQQIQCALSSSSTRIQVVTADRDLRKQVVTMKPMVRGVVNPVTFWRRYLPRLCGYKKPKSSSQSQQP